MRKKTTFINLPTYEECVEKFVDKFKCFGTHELEETFFEKDIMYAEKSETIYSEGNIIKGCYFVYSGILKIYKTGAEGKEQIIRFAKSGDIVGFRSVINQELACTTAKALEDAVVCRIPATTLIDLIKSNSEFAFELIKLTCNELGEANCYLTDIAQKTVRERLAEVLVNLIDDFGLNDDLTMRITITREELANIVGTATESVIRLISDFKHEKIIESEGRRLKILNKNQLIKISHSF